MDKKTKEFLKKYLKEKKGQVILAVILSVLSILMGFLPYFAIVMIIGSFLDQSVTISEIVTLLVLCGLGYGLKILLFECSTTVSHRMAYTVLNKIREDLGDKLLKLPLGVVQDQPIGKLKNILVDQVEMIELPLAHLIPEGIAYILAPLVVFVCLLGVHPLMAGASVLSFILGMVLSAPMMMNMNKSYDAYMASGDQMNSTIVEYVEGIEVIKTFNQSESSYHTFTEAIRHFRNLTLEWFKSTWFSGNLMMAVMPSTLLGVLPAGMFLILRGTLGIEGLVLSVLLSMALIGPMMGLSNYMNSMKMIQYAAQEIQGILDQKELDDKTEDILVENMDITLDHVSFRYHSEDPEPVIDDLSLKLKQGSFTALVGPSGSGKSTVAKLISRFWDVDQGSIKIGERDLRELPLKQLTSLISSVSQDNILFNCSLMENIRMGNPEATDEMVMEASRAARADEFIRKMEKGYDTPAGEAGTRLSGREAENRDRPDDPQRCTGCDPG